MSKLHQPSNVVLEQAMSEGRCNKLMSKVDNIEPANVVTVTTSTTSLTLDPSVELHVINYTSGTADIPLTFSTSPASAVPLVHTVTLVVQNVAGADRMLTNSTVLPAFADVVVGNSQVYTLRTFNRGVSWAASSVSVVGSTSLYVA